MLRNKMNIILNHQPYEVADGCTLFQLAQLLPRSGQGLAFAIDGEIVVRSCWPEYPLCAGQQVSVFSAIAGG
ncbi:MAG: hypothetical protein CENE_01818 [Candidatus Celerinatantimonas neptuna]|nr:MAG: hypothetical protein CENE_01818 [Candidatus Celerinatantimonas neptuna]